MPSLCSYGAQNTKTNFLSASFIYAGETQTDRHESLLRGSLWGGGGVLMCHMAEGKAAAVAGRSTPHSLGV